MAATPNRVPFVGLEQVCAQEVGTVRHDQSSDFNPSRSEPARRGTGKEPERDPWWLRHLRALLGTTALLAALVVLLWQGSLLALALGAPSVGILLLMGLALFLLLAPRDDSRSPERRPPNREA